MPRDQITICNDSTEICKIYAWVREFCERSGVGLTASLNLKLLLEESVVNIMEHGYERETTGKIVVSLHCRYDGYISARVIDEARSYKFSEKTSTILDAKNLNERIVGGLGIILFKSKARSFKYFSKNSRNILCFEIKNE